MSLDIEELLGEEPEKKPVPEKKPDARTARKTARRKAKASASRADNTTTIQVIRALHAPVSASFIADALGMNVSTVRKRLYELPPIGQQPGGYPLYDFRQALPFLVTPRVDMEKVLSSLSASDLPPSLQKDVWDAKLKAQKWMQNAGELWQTDDVLEVLGEAFQRLKTTTQLWIDQISDNHSLPGPARQELVELVDALQTDLHTTLVEMPKEKATHSQAAQLDGVNDG